MAADERRSARLLLADELAAGDVALADLESRALRAAVGSRPVPSWLSRRLQERLVRRGGLTFLGDVAPGLLEARRLVVGDRAPGPPRLLVLADPSIAVHGALRAAGVPYAAVTEPEPAEPELLWQLRRDGVQLALRAPLDGDALDAATRGLRELRLHPAVLVPALDRRAHARWRALTGRFEVAVGEPDAVRHLGFHAGPLWRGPAVWLPTTAEHDGPPKRLRAAADALEAAQVPAWVVLRVRAGDGLPGLAARLAPLARPWEELLAAVALSARL